jgi:hypothetical protein
MFLNMPLEVIKNIIENCGGKIVNWSELQKSSTIILGVDKHYRILTKEEEEEEKKAQQKEQ